MDGLFRGLVGLIGIHLPWPAGVETRIEIYPGLVIGSVFMIRLRGPAQCNVAPALESCALYSPMTVHENIEFPLRARKVSWPVTRTGVANAASMFGIDDLLDRKPSALPGESQRVWIARALVRNPSVMLPDEPHSHTDYRLRTELPVKIRRMRDEMRATTLHVTHDQEEAVALSDRIIVMNNAEIRQIGDGETLRKRPVNIYVAGFPGDPAMNSIEVDSRDGYCATRAGRMKGGEPVGVAGDAGPRPDFRPGHARIRSTSDAAEGFHSPVRVNGFRGERCIVTVETGSGKMRTIDTGKHPDEMGRYSRRLNSGTVAVNAANAGIINAPYGGWKQSGVGGENGREGLPEHLDFKHVRICCDEGVGA